MDIKKRLGGLVIFYHNYLLAYDLIISLVAIYLAYIYTCNYFGEEENLNAVSGAFFSTTASVSATLLGFLIAAITILFAVFDKKNFMIEKFSINAKQGLFNQAYVASFILFILRPCCKTLSTRTPCA